MLHRLLSGCWWGGGLGSLDGLSKLRWWRLVLLLLWSWCRCRERGIWQCVLRCRRLWRSRNLEWCRLMNLYEGIQLGTGGSRNTSCLVCIGCLNVCLLRLSRRFRCVGFCRKGLWNLRRSRLLIPTLILVLDSDNLDMFTPLLKFHLQDLHSQ